MNNEITLYYSSNPQGFFTSEFPGNITANGLTVDDLTVISQEDFDAFWNPPEGKVATWVDGVPQLIDKPELDYLAIAEQQRNDLLAGMQTATYTLNMKLNLGRTLTDDEKATLNAWLDYSDALQALDLSTAPDIEWPEKPA